MKIAIAYDAAADHGGTPDTAGVLDAVRAVADALTRAGHEAVPVAAAAPLDAFLGRIVATDLVVNLVESLAGRAEDEARVAALIECSGRPVTGAPSDTLALCRRKDRVNALLAAAGVPVPEWTLARPGEAPAWDRFPAIVKPAGEDGSVGIDERSVVEDDIELRGALERCTGDALVQRFIGGRELNVGIVGSTVLPVSEIEFSGAQRLVSYAAKWAPGSDQDLGTRAVCPARIPQAMADAARDLALRAWETVGGRGYGRVDLRADDDGRLYVLEVNPNPDLAPDAGLARMAGAAGWRYEDLVARIADQVPHSTSHGSGAVNREVPGDQRAANGHDAVRNSAASGKWNLVRPGAPARLRPLEPADRDQVVRLVHGVTLFSSPEKDVAVEVLDAYLENPGKDYFALGAFTQRDVLLGYACYGPTPCTSGTWDLYWIAVTGEARGRGIGTLLMEEIERRLVQHHARLVLIETSSRADYEPTRGFYERRGYEVVARVPDFYAVGDDRVIFARTFESVQGTRNQ